jgi:hypothetical protein
MEIAACVGLRVAQFEPSALVRCHGGFANTLTSTFLVACGVLSRGDAAELVNNISYLFCEPMERTHTPS